MESKMLTLFRTAVMALLLSVLTGCATMKRTAYFEPEINEPGWTHILTKKGFLQFGDMPSDVAFNCGETKFIFPSAMLASNGSFGPPLIPFPFPLSSDDTEDNSVYVDLKYESPDNKTKIFKSAIILKERTREPYKTVTIETKGDSKSIYRFIFGENWKHTDSFVFEIVTSDPKCGTVSVPYNKYFHVTYSMF
jgi:hypothetical protein